MPSEGHIRPRVQRKSPNTGKPTHDRPASPAAVEVEETRKRMESWMGLGGSNSNSNINNNNKKTEIASSSSKPAVSESSASNNTQPKQQQQPPGAVVVKSILKSPKYSSRSNAVVSSGAIPGVTTTATIVAPEVQFTTATTPNDGENVNDTPSSSSSSIPSSGGVICKDVVVERDPTMAATRRRTFRKAKNHHLNNNNNNNNNNNENAGLGNTYASIEGYVPLNSNSGMGVARASASSAPASASSAPASAAPASAAEDNGTSGGAKTATDDDEQPLIIDSLEGLLKAAGQPLPENPHKITSDTKMVEANISFSVMTQDDYEKKLPDLQQENEEERQKQLEVFLGKRDIFDDDDDDDALEGAVDVEHSDDDDEDAVMELLLGSDIDTDEEPDEANNRHNEPQPPVRAFTLLWGALTNWMTHDTVEWMKALQDQKSDTATTEDDRDRMDTEWTPMVDRSDIGASRCAGVLAMIRLYLGSCLDELRHPVESRRKAEKRLNDLLRTFDYSRENPKLSSQHWKAMACILLDAVLWETRSEQYDLPSSVVHVGMTREEFEYLSRKAVLTFA